MEYSNEKDFLIALGKNLRKVRKAKGFTQAQLANDIGMEISQISRIERGVINTSIGNLYSIANALKIPIAAFFSSIISEKITS